MSVYVVLDGRGFIVGVYRDREKAQAAAADHNEPCRITCEPVL